MAATAILDGLKNFPPADFSCYVSKLSSCKISAFGHKNELFDSIFPLSTSANEGDQKYQNFQMFVLLARVEIFIID